MAWRGKKRPRSERSGSKDDSTPSYLRFRFVFGVVLLAVLIGFILLRVGAGQSSKRSNSNDDERAVVDVEADVAPRSTDPKDCPEPGEPVSMDAAQLLAVFEAAVADPNLGTPPASEDVEKQLEATSPLPTLIRMTRIQGFSGGDESWATCVMSYWMGPDGPMQSLDVVTLGVVDGADRSDADPDGGSSSSTGSRSRSRNLPDRWEVTKWLRGQPQLVPLTRVAPLSFFNGSGCSNPSRLVSVGIPDGPPSDRLRSALEELISGPSGRAPSVSSSVPVDLQVIDATVDGSSVVVTLTPTSDQSLTRCESTGAYAQIVDTAEAIARESLPPDAKGDAARVDVEILVDGEKVDTIRS